LIVPSSIAIASFRYRLWDVEPLISRTLVYGALTAAVIGVYGVIVGTLSALFHTQGNLFISLVATGLVAILFQPMREQLQQVVNRLVFGQREEPVAVLARLGQDLSASLPPETVLSTLVQTVAHALKTRYVAIALKDGRTFNVAVAAGAFVPGAVELPLVYQGETIGLLIVAPPVDGSFKQTDVPLLETITHQASTAVYAARLTADLQQARQRLITAREEERRRLRRDLHDGLGSTLASQGLKLAAVQQLLLRDLAAAARLINEVLAENNATVTNIRRLIYQLRPPALDEVGLAGAIRHQGAGRGDASWLRTGLQLSVEEPPGGLPALPAAVEVAAYYIAREALTNVIRHAQASRCLIRLEEETNGSSKHLCLTIQDDGAGLPQPMRVGVGLVSMRERAQEIGGTLTIDRVAGGGTQVIACLPLEVS
jgi:signal transduction histidine kinase